MTTIQFYHSMPVSLDGDGDGQEAFAKKLIMEFLGIATWPSSYEVGVSIEGDDGDEMEAEITWSSYT